MFFFFHSNSLFVLFSKICKFWPLKMLNLDSELANHCYIILGPNFEKHLVDINNNYRTKFQVFTHTLVLRALLDYCFHCFLRILKLWLQISPLLLYVFALWKNHNIQNGLWNLANKGGMAVTMTIHHPSGSLFLFCVWFPVYDNEEWRVLWIFLARVSFLVMEERLNVVFKQPNRLFTLFPSTVTFIPNELSQISCFNSLFVVEHQLRGGYSRTL